MSEYFLAVDIGASSGRHMIGYLEDGKIKLEEVYRFENGMSMRNDKLCWDLDHLFNEIVNGLSHCVKIGKKPSYMGIDTWAVDFVLLNEFDKIIGDSVGYRDSRTDGIEERVYERISEETLYAKTGIQKLNFNTIFQLMAVKSKNPEQLEMAKSFMMIPDYFNFLLTGVKKTEYTNATSTGMINANDKTWDKEIITALGINDELFGELSAPGTVVGNLRAELVDKIGFDVEILLPATHDTASAVVAVPSNEDNVLYLSSGTWSLMGVERLDTDTSLKSREYNFSHEGGYLYRYRYLKNIMGLWMIQELKRELDNVYSFAELCQMAANESITTTLDCQDMRFLSPVSMIDAIQDFCREKDLQVPVTPGELASVVYRSLAKCYKETVNEIEEMMNITYSKIHIIGGGSNAYYLNQLTADYTGKEVFSGPSEATAIGNIVVQMITKKTINDLKEARHMIFNSFEINSFKGA